MNWIWLGIFSALLLGVYDLFRKAALTGNAVLPVLWISSASCAAPFVLLMALGRVPAADAHVHVLMAIKAVIVASSWVLEFFALKHLPISVAAPVRASQPFFTLIGAVTFFGEHLSIGRWIGVVLTLVSYFFFSVTGKREGTGFRGNKWIACAFGASLIGACSSLYDKFLLNRCALNPVVVQSWYMLYIVGLLGVILMVLWWPRRAHSTAFRWRWSLPLIGLSLAASDAMYFHALRDPDALIAMLTTIRRANVVIAFGVGAVIFGEANIRPKAMALAGIVGGLVLMTLA